MDLINRESVLNWCRKTEWDTPDERWRPESEFGRFVESLPSARPNEWIPIKMRPMTAEERAYFEEHFGPCLDCEAVMYDCPMPEDGQRILISTRWGVDEDTCDVDGQFMGLETRGDWNGVLAWMPFPEPYEVE